GLCRSATAADPACLQTFQLALSLAIWQDVRYAFSKNLLRLVAMRDLVAAVLAIRTKTSSSAPPATEGHANYRRLGLLRRDRASRAAHQLRRQRHLRDPAHQQPQAAGGGRRPRRAGGAEP